MCSTWSLCFSKPFQALSWIKLGLLNETVCMLTIRLNCSHCTAYIVQQTMHECFGKKRYSFYIILFERSQFFGCPTELAWSFFFMYRSNTFTREKCLKHLITFIFHLESVYVFSFLPGRPFPFLSFLHNRYAMHTNTEKWVSHGSCYSIHRLTQSKWADNKRISEKKQHNNITKSKI